MIRADQIDTWIFDLDNTLYPARANLFAQIDVRMKQYIAALLDLDHDSAHRLQKQYFQDHGTTMRGLMDRHGVAPDDFLEFVHDIDMSVLDPAPALAAGLAALPGRKLVFTNGDAPYARRVLEALALADQFEDIHDIRACAYRPKPELSAYHGLVDRFGFDPRRAVFVEDMARNLKPAKGLGMATVWINNGSEKGADTACTTFIDEEVGDVLDWVTHIGGRLGGSMPSAENSTTGKERA